MGKGTLASAGMVALLALAGCGSTDAAPEESEKSTEAVEATEGQEAGVGISDAEVADLIERENEAFTALFENPGPESQEAYDAIGDEVDGLLGEIEDADDLPEWVFELKTIELAMDMGATPQQILDGDLPEEPSPDSQIAQDMLGCEEGQTMEECEAAYEEGLQEDFLQYDLEECEAMVESGETFVPCTTSGDEEEFYKAFEEEYGYPVPEEHRP
ncbi:hypothetical protein [Nesterenkonia halobia]|uniref:Lipoprotein n=1 Tax=Nesterenkonia halobia TaxID=37922 RepID=A0ABP6RGS0_9MICC